MDDYEDNVGDMDDDRIVPPPPMPQPAELEEYPEDMVVFDIDNLTVKEIQQKIKTYRDSGDQRLKNTAKAVKLSQKKAVLLEKLKMLNDLNNKIKSAKEDLIEKRVKAEAERPDTHEYHGVEVDSHGNFHSVKFDSRTDEGDVQPSLRAIYNALDDVVNKIAEESLTVPSFDPENKDGYTPSSGSLWTAVFIIRNIKTGAIRRVAIGAGYTSTFEKFLERLKEIANGKVHGSDPIDFNEWELDTRAFVLNIFGHLSQPEQHGGGSMVYHLMEQPNDGMCTHHVIKYVCDVRGLDYDDVLKRVFFISEITPQQPANSDILTNFLHTHECEIVYDQIRVTKEFMTKYYRDRSKLKELPLYAKTKWHIIPTVSIGSGLNPKKIPVYATREHVGILEGEYHDGVFTPRHDSKLLISDKFEFAVANVGKTASGSITRVTLNQASVINNTHIAVPVKYFFFDLEAVVDMTTFNYHAYSSAWCCTTSDVISKLGSQDPKVRKQGKSQLKVRFELGFETCMSRMIEDFDREAKGFRVVLITFNGTNYDNFITIEWMLKNKMAHRLSNIRFVGNSILNAHIDKFHDFFDLHKHLPGSLKSNCDGFKVDTPKTSFDHTLAQQLYNEGKLIETLGADAALRDYNCTDVISMIELFARYNSALKAIDGFNSFSLTDKKTIGGMVKSVWEEDVNKLAVELPKFSITQKKLYDDMVKFKVAGRTEVYTKNKVQNTRVASVDICSAYPYVMCVMESWYPCGKIVVTDKFVEGKIGFYYCDIEQSDDKPKVYPKKTPEGNEWDFTGTLENYLINTVDIDTLQRHGAKVTVKNGFYFTSRIRGSELFRIILALMKGKCDQSALKSAKSDQYNPAILSTLKLCMNSLSGKVIERLHTSKTELLGNEDELWSIMARHSNTGLVDAIGGHLLVQYKVSEEEIFAQQSPAYLACIIYSLTRTHLYDHVISKVPRDALFYGDTDSVHLRYDAYLKWVRDYASKTPLPHDPAAVPYDKNLPRMMICNRKTTTIGDHEYDFFEKSFGCFEDEIPENDIPLGRPNNLAIYGAKKVYWIGHITADGVITTTKKRMKGIRDTDLHIPRNIGDLLADLPAELQADVTIEVEGKRKLNYTNMMAMLLFHGNNSNRGLKLGLNHGQNSYNAMRELIEYGSCEMLCFSMKRSIKNTKNCVSLDDTGAYSKTAITVSACVGIKKISI